MWPIKGREHFRKDDDMEKGAQGARRMSLGPCTGFGGTVAMGRRKLWGALMVEARVQWARAWDRGCESGVSIKEVWLSRAGENQGRSWDAGIPGCQGARVAPEASSSRSPGTSWQPHS